MIPVISLNACVRVADSYECGSMVSETTLISETPRPAAASANHFISAIFSSRVNALSANSPSAHFAATASMSAAGVAPPEAQPVTSSTAAADMAKPTTLPLRTFLFNIFTFRIAVDGADLVPSTFLELEELPKSQNDEQSLLIEFFIPISRSPLPWLVLIWPILWCCCPLSRTRSPSPVQTR